MRRLLLVLLLAVFVPACGALAPAPAIAQATAAAQQLPDYEAWAKVVQRAEEAVDARRASDTAFDQLRSDLADWRTRFLAAQSTNESRIRTLREQISALGPAPAEGESEPQEIADRRAELQTQLAELQAPALRAVEAYSQADGLISEVDAIIRERQAEELLHLGPSPVNPANWGEAWHALVRITTGWRVELGQSWRNPSDRAEMREGLPATALFLALAGVLLLRGRHWMEALTLLVVRQNDTRGRNVYSSIVSLGQIVVPFAGVFCLTAALNSSALLGTRTERVVELLPILGFTIFFARWLGGRVFAAESVSHPIFTLPPGRQAEGRLISGLLGLLLALAFLMGAMADFNAIAFEARVVLNFPLLVGAGLILARTGQLLLAAAGGAQTGGDGAREDSAYRSRLVQFEGRAAIMLGLLSPALAAIGYVKLANYLAYSSILTLALFGLVLVLQRFVTDVYDLITGRDAAETTERGDALIPVLIGMVLVLLALPVLALIWGARIADLTELWASFTEGFSIGDTKISPSDFLTFVIVFAVFFTLTRVVQGMLRSTVLPKTKIDPGGRESLLSIIGYVGVLLALVIAVTTAGIDLSGLAIVAGALSVGIGFGLQTIVQNFVSGIILLLERPVTQGDWIEVGGTMGIVKQISVRSTRIETFDRTDVIVPNADLISGSVTNWTKQNLTGRVIIEVGVAYGTDTRKVERILREIGENHPLVMINPPPFVVFQRFGADALDFELRVILRDINYGLGVRTELNHEIARRFAEEGIEIPFAQRDIWLRNPETLRQGTTAQAPGPAPETALPTGPVPPEHRPERTDLDGNDDGDGDGGESR